MVGNGFPKKRRDNMKSLEEIRKLVEPIIGSSPEECFALYKAVHDVAGLDGKLVEIGSLYGRTTCAIALAAKENDEKLVSIDYLFQYPDLETCRLGGYETYPAANNIEDAFKKSTHLQFYKHLIERDLFDNVISIASKSENAHSIWNNPIKFIFIDADHSYEGVKKDFELFEPFVVSGGLIGMHDVDPVGHPGVVKYFREIMETGKYHIVWHGDGTSCRILRKK